MNGKLYKLDLTKHGIEPFDEFGINGHAAAGINNAGANKTNGAAVPLVFWNGETASIARKEKIRYTVFQKTLLQLRRIP